MRVKPAPGRTVRDPHTMALLSDDGRDVKDTDLFWQRRLRDGDVTIDEGGDAAPARHSRHHEPPPRKEA